ILSVNLAVVDLLNNLIDQLRPGVLFHFRAMADEIRSIRQLIGNQLVILTGALVIHDDKNMALAKPHRIGVKRGLSNSVLELAMLSDETIARHLIEDKAELSVAAVRLFRIRIK